MKRNDELASRIDALIKGPQYKIREAEKDTILTPILKELCISAAKNSPYYRAFLSRLGGDIAHWEKIADIPFLPVAVFKEYPLMNVPRRQIVRELNSSGTTGQKPSRIFIDKQTAFRQTRALVSVLKEFLGSARRPYLVLDIPESVTSGEVLTARGAAIRGISNFASKTVFGMKKTDGDMKPDFNTISTFFGRHKDEEVIVFGFTFIVWSRFLLKAEEEGINFSVQRAKVLHSGGWKKLRDQEVNKEEFNRRIGNVIGCPPSSVLDFYGMVEQVGTVFVDCELGHKHPPAFSDVVIREPYSLEPIERGKTGIIEVISVLPTSYPGHALLTEDMGILVGIDDCPCGRKGIYFCFTSRVEKADIRGCGDTFANSKKII